MIKPKQIPTYLEIGLDAVLNKFGDQINSYKDLRRFIG